MWVPVRFPRLTSGCFYSCLCLGAKHLAVSWPRPSDEASDPSIDCALAHPSNHRPPDPSIVIHITHLHQSNHDTSARHLSKRPLNQSITHMSGITPTIPTDLLTRCPPHTRWVDPVPKNLRSLRTKLMALDPTASGQERWVQVFFHLDPFEQVLTYATKHGQPLGTRPSLRCAETKVKRRCISVLSRRSLVCF